MFERCLILVVLDCSLLVHRMVSVSLFCLQVHLLGHFVLLCTCSLHFLLCSILHDDRYTKVFLII